MNLDLNKIDKSWTLFIDRDGVINIEKYNDYINTWDEFKFYDGIFEAMKILATKFKYIIVITNQRGVAKGNTKLADLEIIHKNMKQQIEQNGGRIDAIYYCAEMESINRKPNIGMGLQAIKDFNEIDLTKSLMVGNTLSDMKFGRNLGVRNIFLSTTRPEVNLTHEDIDLHFNSLINFAITLTNK